MYAVISDRNQQHTVRTDDVIFCDLNTDLEPGAEVVFDKVLLVSSEGNVRTGKPFVDGAKVTGKAIDEAKGPKLVTFRFKRRKNVRVKNGHRQSYTAVRITSIDG